MPSTAEQFELMEDKFSHWLNRPEIKEEYIMDCHRIQDGDMTPGVFRWAMKIAFEAGYNTRLKEDLGI